MKNKPNSKHASTKNADKKLKLSKQWQKSGKTADSISSNHQFVKNKLCGEKHRKSSRDSLRDSVISNKTSNHYEAGTTARIEEVKPGQKTAVSNPGKQKHVKLGAEKQSQYKESSGKISKLEQAQSKTSHKSTNSSSNNMAANKSNTANASNSHVTTSEPSAPSHNVETSEVLSNKTANKKHKKKHSKKNLDGVSNWMKLCTTLKIDATARKSKPVKRPATECSVETERLEPKRVKPNVWFDNVDKILIEPAHTGSTTDVSGGGDYPGSGKTSGQDTTNKLVKPDSFKGLTNCVAMDCEMVGVGPQGDESILARVSIVNHFGVCLYDKFVLPREKVVDYRTFVSGVTPENLATGEEFTKVQTEVSDMLRGRILVGHALHNDLRVLFLTHPHKMIRDTSQYKPFRELFKGRIPSLKKLSDRVLAVHVQEGQHSSVQDAQAAMRLYTMYRQKWEKELRKESRLNKKRNKKK